ncbi:hypothetical protein [Niabella drilacis]|uniref:Uncharacterized protein n=1 Tax=Niabella drilacis (strain DSM 25811 / CCM 8410 / CCUG 62505 / LMG 26954 / E90) TaxID=1285928 RepID=A0A1G6WK00_NIADE|nr:hypothetical protein [Niabella drilacis]SDD66023.1 hypothetical protein SAMN04487894_111155 [Niabella drilacis]
MKKLIPIITAMGVACLFTQCKKKNTPVPSAPIEHKIEYGHYIIRSKYMCSDGKAFVLGSFSNRETLGWTRFTPEEVKFIKEDGQPANNTYVWYIGKTVYTGNSVETTPNPAGGTGFINSIRYYSIFQDDLANNTRWYLSVPENEPNEIDHAGFGTGPSWNVRLQNFAKEDLPSQRITIANFSVSDSSSRFLHYAGSRWWYLSLPTDDKKVCDEFNNAVIWRHSWLCPNTTVIGDGWNAAWKGESCGISELILEKVD